MPRAGEMSQLRRTSSSDAQRLHLRKTRPSGIEGIMHRGVTRKLLEKDVPSEEFSKMLESGKTNLITGFRSRKTRKLFDAFLALDNKGKLRFEFPPREAKVAESN